MRPHCLAAVRRQDASSTSCEERYLCCFGCCPTAHHQPAASKNLWCTHVAPAYCSLAPCLWRASTLIDSSEAGQVFALTRAANSRCLQPRAGYKGIRDTCAALLALRLPSVQRSPTCGTPRTRWTSASRLEVNARKAALQVLGGSGCREWHMRWPKRERQREKRKYKKIIRTNNKTLGRWARQFVAKGLVEGGVCRRTAEW